MADRLLMETHETDGICLEDGSGVVLLETTEEAQTAQTVPSPFTELYAAGRPAGALQ